MKMKDALKRVSPPRVRRFLRLVQTQLSSSSTPPPARSRQTQVKFLIEQYCTGKGIEIGPGKHPYCDSARALFLDRYIDNKDGSRNPDIVSDASRVPVTDSYFDFLFSAHCLEHCPNTLNTLYEWKRVIRPGGVIFLVLPHGDRTFDRHRAKTTLQHHISDYAVPIKEPDYSHVDEMREGWSKNDGSEELERKYEREWGAPVWDFEFRIKNSVLHYHVWTQNEMIDILQYVGLKILYVVDALPERDDSFLVIAKK